MSSKVKLIFDNFVGIMKHLILLKDKFYTQWIDYGIEKLKFQLIQWQRVTGNFTGHGVSLSSGSDPH